MNAHTRGPWSLYEPDVTEYPTRAAFEIYTPSGADPGRSIATVWHKEKVDQPTFGSEAEANARRIVACVNACAGIPTESLEALALHRCDNPPCVNPDDLFVGTAKDNTAGMISKGRAAWQRI